MEKLIHVTGREMTQILQRACDHNLPFELVSEHDADNAPPMRSRFLLRPADGSLAVDAPTRAGIPVILPANQRVFAAFNLQHQPYQFDTSTIRRDNVQLNAQKSIAALVLATPMRIERIQRRSSFRVRISRAERKIGHLWLLQHLDDEDEQKPRVKPLGEVDITDLSAGGVGLLISDPQAQQLKPTDQVIIAVPLQQPANFIRLQADIRTLRPIAEGGSIVGLQFLGLDDTPEGRAMRQQLEHYVAALERDQLQRLKRQI